MYYSKWKKLPQLIVFKGMSEGTLYKKLHKIPLVKKNKILIACQPNSWVAEEIFYEWLDKIWFKTTNIK